MSRGALILSWEYFNYLGGKREESKTMLKTDKNTKSLVVLFPLLLPFISLAN